MWMEPLPLRFYHIPYLPSTLPYHSLLSTLILHSRSILQPTPVFSPLLSFQPFPPSSHTYQLFRQALLTVSFPLWISRLQHIFLHLDVNHFSLHRADEHFSNTHISVPLSSPKPPHHDYLFQRHHHPSHLILHHTYTT